jgi:hypothetical protein
LEDAVGEGVVPKIAGVVSVRAKLTVVESRFELKCCVGKLSALLQVPRAKMMRRFPGELMPMLAASSVTVT